MSYVIQSDFSANYEDAYQKFALISKVNAGPSGRAV